ncbi:class I SAM-dependent methyltransferase [Phyllobacterium sp. 628]|uniref:class I SAM-dependent methyltransferase n=1 Tax=Phyllobacterium sp. 628 TaxID=2718938 RepID=UPI0016623A0E|nr:class I SAM-dependent methyltransferase [Phyllobacterium sp. 628]QND51658.1 class I SAM-dependent methyltransferase [Phyllobacterium sp. 628]
MKGRESGMPEEASWSAFFDAEAAVLALLGPQPVDGNVVEFGCGYGTFTLPAARRTNGIVTALDIEPDMIASVKMKAAAQSLPNIAASVRDFVAGGTGLDANSQAHAMIFNLLHLEHPVALLREAHRIIRPGGVLSVMHWRSDIPTPRGPPLTIRPLPQQCAGWIGEAGFDSIIAVDLSPGCPYHFGMVARR